MGSVSGSGPIAPRILLGIHLRRLREAAGVSAREAALTICGSESKVSRLERGQQAPKETDVADLLVRYNVTDELRDDLLSLARRAAQPGWWVVYRDLLPPWFHVYLGLEQAANKIRTFESQYVPGLLQTARYAAAVISMTETDEDEVERKVTLRMTRQRRFLDGRLRVWAVVDEAALRRSLGGGDVMREQLEYLLTAGKRPNLTLQVTPFSAGGHAAPGGFSILRFPYAELPDVVYLEQLTNAEYLDRLEEVDAYALAMTRVSVVSATPEESAGIITAILEQTPPG